MGATASSNATAVEPGKPAALAPSGLVAVLEGGRQQRQRCQSQRRGGGASAHGMRVADSMHCANISLFVLVIVAKGIP